MAKSDLSKKEARLRRKIEKLAKNREKNVRLSSNIQVKDKFVRSSVTPRLEKMPLAADPDNYKKHYFSWCDEHSDTAGQWSWGEDRQWSDNEYAGTISPHMNSYINCSWGELERQTYDGKKRFRKLLNKYQPLDSICNEARDRWLSLDTVSEFDRLFRFRLGSYKRIWGVRIQHHFFMIWYERFHRICPIDN